jgi:hypothetical protein
MTIVVKYPSKEQLMAIFFMYNNGKKIAFENQLIYRNRDCFNRAMNELARAKRLRKRSFEKENEYKLTLEGELIKEVLDGFVENNR